jgi:hypothetical protein
MLLLSISVSSFFMSAAFKVYADTVPLYQLILQKAKDT